MTDYYYQVLELV
jgi:hypothetical protein